MSVERGIKRGSKSLTEKTFSGFLWVISGGVLQAILKILVLALLARKVTPVEFGVMGIALMVVDFSKMFTHMGVGPAIVQKDVLEDRHLHVGFTLSLAMGLFFTIVLQLVAPWLAAYFRMAELERVVRVVSLIFLIDSFTLMAQALLQRNMKFRLSTAIEVITYAIGYGGVGVVCAFLGWGVWSLVMATLSQALLFMVAVVWAQPFPKRMGTDGPAFRELLFFGGGMTLSRFGNFLAIQGDNLVVGRMLGAGALGIYGRAYQFMAMPSNLLGNALDKALFPAMAKVQTQPEKLAKAYLAGVGIIALVAIPTSVLIVLLANEIVVLLLGADWMAVVKPLQVLSASLLFRMSYKMTDPLARAVGAVYERAWRQWIYAGLILVGAFIGQFWQLEGVATGVAIALFINFLMMAQLSQTLAGFRWEQWLTAHLRGMLLGASTVAVGMLSCAACRTFAFPALATLVSVVLCTLLAASIVLFLFPAVFIDSAMREMGESFLKKFISTSHA